jgi:hypothetical protein
VQWSLGMPHSGYQFPALHISQQFPMFLQAAASSRSSAKCPLNALCSSFYLFEVFA